MHLIKTVAIVLAFFVSTSTTKIVIKKSEPAETGLIKAAVDILESCYGNCVTSLGLAGNLSGSISKKLWSGERLSVTLIDATARIVNHGRVHPISRNRLQVFVISASSAITLTRTLKQIKLTVWWNHMAAFLILDMPPSNHGCSNAFEMLWAAWKMNILNANLMCHHRTKGRLIYTFNPYTKYAPGPWKLDRTSSGKHHPWSLFVRAYGESEEVCSELNFEKANDLGGYEIRVSVTDESFGQDHVKSDRLCAGIYEDLYCKIVFPALNATPKVLVHKSLNSVGYVDDKGNPHGILAELFDGKSDISLMVRYLTSLPNVTTTYPPWLSELRSLTQYRGYKSQLSKIHSVIDRSSHVLLYLCSVISILFFKYVLRQPIVVATLSTLRVIWMSSLPKTPREVAPRIYLACLFLAVLTIQGIYQGQLASLLTRHDPLRNVNTRRDLAELGHTIYGSPSYRMYFSDPEFKERFVPTNGLTCTEYALRDPKAACLGDTSIIIYDAAKLKLHMSGDTLAPMFAAFPIRPDWPLEQRFNMVLMRSVETHRIQYLYENITRKTFRILEFQANEHKDRTVKMLTLEELRFTFVILAIGLGCATINFLIEMGLGPARRRIVKTLRRLNHRK